MQSKIAPQLAQPKKKSCLPGTADKPVHVFTFRCFVDNDELNVDQNFLSN